MDTNTSIAVAGIEAIIDSCCERGVHQHPLDLFEDVLSLMVASYALTASGTKGRPAPAIVEAIANAAIAELAGLRLKRMAAAQ